MEKMMATIRKNGISLMEIPLSRFSINEGNFSLGIKSKQMFDIPMLFGNLYEITLVTPEQTLIKNAVYLSYNYMVFSNTYTQADGSETTSLDCSDNGLLFRIAG